MPQEEYYGGHGREVMGSMMKQYGKKKGKQVFYATANKRKQNPGEHMGKKKSMMNRPEVMALMGRHKD